MKKILLVLTVLLLTALLLTSCGESDEITDTVTLNVYNWGEYISDGFEGMPDTNAMFEDYFNTYLAHKYGYKIKVNYTTASGMNAYQYFELTETLVQLYLDKDGSVDLILRGAAGLQNLVFTAEIVSTAPNGTSVVIGSTPLSV